MRREVIFCLAAAMLANPVSAQKPAEDTKGESAVSLFEKPLGTFTLNAADKKIEFNWTTYAFSSERFWAAGLDASTKAENGLGSILKTGSVVTETEVGIRLARLLQRPGESRDFVKCMRRANTAEPASRREELIAACEDIYGTGPGHSAWIFARGSYTAAKHTLVNTTNAFGDQIDKREFSGLGGEIGLNGWRGKGAGTIIGGISIGLQKTNNADDLDDVVVRDKLGTFTDTSGVVRDISNKEVAGLRGNYKVFNEVPLKADLMITRRNTDNVGLWVFGRLSERNKEDDKESAGLGAFFFDKNPFTPAGSVSVEWQNPGWALNLVASLPIGFNLK